MDKQFLHMQKLAGLINESQYTQKKSLLENQVNEFKKLLQDLETDLEKYNGDQVVYEEDSDSMEVKIIVFPGDFKKEIQNIVSNVLKKNKLFMVDKESIKRDRDKDGIILSFDIIKK